MLGNRTSWRDPERYQYLANATSAQIAWEFLRRNRLYRKTYEMALTEDIGAKKRAGRQEAQRKIDEICERFRIEKLTDPSSSLDSEQTVFRSPQPRVSPVHLGLAGEAKTVHVKLTKPGEVVIKLDLRQGIQAQLDAVHAILRDRAKQLMQSGVKLGVPQRRLPNARYILLLRVLDAMRAKVLVTDICTALDGNAGTRSKSYTATNYRDDLKMARRLRDGGYQALAFLPLPSKPKL